MLAPSAGRGAHRRAAPAASAPSPSTRLALLKKRPLPLQLTKASQNGNGGDDDRATTTTTSTSFPLAQLATIAAALALGATALATDPDLLDGGNSNRRTTDEQASLLKQWRGQRTGGAAAYSSSSSSYSTSSVPTTLMIATVDGQPFALDADLVPGGAEALRRSAAAAEAEAELGQPLSSASSLLSASPAISTTTETEDSGAAVEQRRQNQPNGTTTKRRLALLAARFSPGDAAASLMWSVAYWYVSPAQLLIIFLGRIEPERSSSWLLRTIGFFPAVVVCGAGGLATAVLSSAAFGSATWAVAGGLGALAAAGFIEIGRPRELGEREYLKLRRRQQEFGSWASQRLTATTSARCHEREILAAFRRDAVARRSARRVRRLRRKEELEATSSDGSETETDTEDDAEDDDDASWDEETIRDLVRAWAGPGAERSRSGYWKGVGLATVATAVEGGQR
jgi:hypothetical protein